MEKTGSSVSSALSAIAQHEQFLLAKQDEADGQGEAILKAARIEAARIAEEAASSLSAEITRIQREAEMQREAERLQRIKKAQEKLERMRQDAEAKARIAVRSVVALVLPPTGQRAGDHTR